MNIIRFILRRIYLFIYLAKKHFFRNLFSSLGLLISLLIVVFILGILRPVKKIIIQKMEGSLPSELIRIKSKPTSSNNLIGNLFFKNNDRYLGVKNNQIQQIRKIKYISHMYYSQILQSSATGRLMFPKMDQFRFELMIQGVSKSLIRPYLKCMKNFRPQYKKQKNSEQKLTILPVVIPEKYAEIMYAYASINGFQGFNLKKAVGIDLRITLGDSVVIRSSNEQTFIMGKICGFIPDGLISTLGVPLTWVKKHHFLNNQKKAANSYDQVFIKISNPKYKEQIKKKIRKIGLVFPKSKKNYKKLYYYLNKLDYIFWFIAGILLILTTIAMGNSFMLLAIEKKHEFGLFLVFGASPLFIMILMFFEGAFWGWIHSTLSIFLSKEIFSFLPELLKDITWLPISLTELKNIQFQLTDNEKYYIVFFSSLLAGASSLLPTFITLGKKTLTLIKKD